MEIDKMKEAKGNCLHRQERDAKLFSGNKLVFWYVSYLFLFVVFFVCVFWYKGLAYVEIVSVHTSFESLSFIRIEEAAF